MKHSKKSAIFLTVVVCMFFITSEVNAEWIDEWFSNATYGGYTPGSHGHSQQRGFASFGSYRLRNTQTTPDNFISIQSPSIKAGCGGVDLLGGSVQFLRDPQLLMQKAQNIVSGALYIGFEMAMAVLNENLTTTYRNAESVINTLNSLQINDCATSRTITTSAVDAWNWDNKAAGEKWSRWAEDSGASNLFTSTQKIINGTSQDNPNLPAASVSGVPAIISTCPADLQALLNTTSLLRTMLSAKGYNNDAINVVRGIFGDYTVSATKANYVKPCGPNVKLNPIDVLKGTIGQKMNDAAYNGSCVAQNGNFTFAGQNYANIETWVRTNLQEIAYNIRTKTALSPANSAFLEAIPAPVYMHLKSAVLTGGENVAIAAHEDVCISGYTFQIVASLYGALNENIIRARQIISSQQPNVSTCDASAISQLLPALSAMEQKAGDFYAQAYDRYSSDIGDFNQWAWNASLTQQFQDTVMASVAKTFGSSLAARVSGKG